MIVAPQAPSLPQSVSTYLAVISCITNVIVFGRWLYKTLVGLFQRRLITGFFGGKELTIRIPVRSPTHLRGIVGLQDLQAAIDLAEFLRKHECKPSFTQLLPNEELTLSAGTILICGPKSNKRIDDLLQSDPWLRFREQPSGQWIIEDLASHNEFVSPMDRLPPQDADIAYLGRVQSSLSGPQVILISGVHAVGSVGVVSYLTQLPNLKALRHSVGKGRFSVVLMAKFMHSPFKVLHVELLTAPHTH